MNHMSSSMPAVNCCICTRCCMRMHSPLLSLSIQMLQVACLSIGQSPALATCSLLGQQSIQDPGCSRLMLQDMLQSGKSYTQQHLLPATLSCQHHFQVYTCGPAKEGHDPRSGRCNPSTHAAHFPMRLLMPAIHMHCLVSGSAALSLEIPSLSLQTCCRKKLNGW